LLSASVITDSAIEKKALAINEVDITRQKIADEKIRQLNINLQNNVDMLELANKDLESFSYSVSHDLRAPLRAINGFSQIIEEDYSGGMNKDALELFEGIRKSSRGMGILIDDLLAFSKLGKKQISKTDVDMESLVESVLSELNRSTPHSSHIHLMHLPSAEGDPSLLSHVWTNLISNAIKYSSKKESSQVEIGSSQSEGKTTYYVKDNGAGFDMKYSKKLFQVFQRFHSASEFEGTGVGLAIAHRIITKHGGHIWAESLPNEGASFYFTLTH
jgi:light-regulated signal transduction histidine kinase (bacteriophytochrome)